MNASSETYSLDEVFQMFNPANAMRILSGIPGTGIEEPREVVDIEAEEIDDELNKSDYPGAIPAGERINNYSIWI